MSMFESWMNELTPSQRLKFAALAHFMGESGVADALCDIDSIDDLWEHVAEKVYASAKLC